MTTNEETIAMGGEKKEVKKSNASREWKNVAIGGAAGIMFGAGSAYAAGKLANGDEAAEKIPAGQRLIQLLFWSLPALVFPSSDRD